VKQTSSAKDIGTLVVDYVVPGGPVNGHVEPTDIPVRVNNENRSLHYITPDYSLE
jgi:hypothetical protein